MKTILICFAGRIASGKTTLSKAVAGFLKWPLASFGDYVRMEAHRKGLNESRDVLQMMGASLVEEPDDFCHLVLQQVSWKPGLHLVIEGIRHSKILDSLRRLTDPSEVFLVFVETEEQTIKRRLAERNASGGDKLSDFEAHSTEREVRTDLPAAADLIIDGSRPVDILVREIVSWLQKESDL